MKPCFIDYKEKHLDLNVKKASYFISHFHKDVKNLSPSHQQQHL